MNVAGSMGPPPLGPSGPPYPYPPPPPPAGGLPVWAQVLIGVFVGPPVLVGSAWVPSVLLSALVGVVDGTPGLLLPVLGLAVPLGLLVAGIAWRPTRWYAVGAIIGVALLFVVLAGACLALIASLG